MHFPTRRRGYEKEFCAEFIEPQVTLPMHLSIAPDTRNPFGARPRRARFTAEKVTIAACVNAKQPPGENWPNPVIYIVYLRV